LDSRDAESLLAGAIPNRAGIWADLGAGDGTFTRALLGLLGPNALVYAIDHDREALATLMKSTGITGENVIPLVADIARPFDLPGRAQPALDGLLLANVLHYFRDPAALLGRFVAWLQPQGRVVIVEYDGRRANRWVPYPISRAELPGVVQRAGLSAPTITASRPSAYGGTIYVAAAEK
jgi:trans-aconitate methyltransferase